MTRRYLTYCDALDALFDFGQAQNTGLPPAQMRRAILDAYDEVTQDRDWSFLKATGRLFAHAAQDDGTVSYNTTTRNLTLTGSTWPSWAGDASVFVNGVVCDVASRTSDTVVVLDSIRNPGETLTDETYMIFERWLALPDDFLNTTLPMTDTFRNFGVQVSMEEFEALHKYDSSASELQCFALGPNPKGAGLAMFLYPAFSTTMPVDFVYRRRRRDLRITGKETADGTGTIGTSGTAITGTSTTFSAFMVGSVLRISANTTKPTGLDGTAQNYNPFVEEHIIATYTSALAMVSKTTMGTYTGKAYVVSDPIDLERHVWGYFKRCCEKRLTRNPKALRDAEALAQQAYDKACEADTVALPCGIAGRGGRRHATRLADLYQP